MLSELGETGVFGRSSTLKRVAGVIVPPEGKTQNACSPNTSFRKLKNSQTWLALVERGGCTFTQKIKVAVENGASGVIIYNFPGTGNQVFPMSHQIFEDIVVSGIKEKASKEIIKNNLVEHFRKELFDQIMFRMGVDDIADAQRTPKNEKILGSLLANTIKRWKSLIKECNKYKESYNLISEHDLDGVFDTEESDDSGDSEEEESEEE
jgi:hypothetical protein